MVLISLLNYIELVNKQKLAAEPFSQPIMSKEIKQNCQRMIDKMETKLEDLRISIKTKKGQSILEKLLTQIINDFKFLHDDFKVISQHLDFLQAKSFQKDNLISTYEKELLAKNAEKKIFEQMMRSKYEKLAKEHKFLDFVGKNGNRNGLSHQRVKSEFIKKGLSELEKDIVESNKRLCIKVKQLKSQIQNQEQGYLTFQNPLADKISISDINISRIDPEGNFFLSPSKALEKKDKLKGLHLDMDDNITVFKTKKKELSSKNYVEQSLESFKQKELKSSETVMINRKKKEELADLIAQQTKIIVSKQKYFSTDI